MDDALRESMLYPDSDRRGCAWLAIVMVGVSVFGFAYLLKVCNAY